MNSEGRIHDRSSQGFGRSWSPVQLTRCPALSCCYLPITEVERICQLTVFFIACTHVTCLSSANAFPRHDEERHPTSYHVHSDTKSEMGIRWVSVPSET